MNKEIKILAVQNSSVLGDKKANFDKVAEMLSSYKACRPDLIVLPEVWAVGWLCGTFPEIAENDLKSETLDFLSNLALEYNANVVGGSYIAKSPKKDSVNAFELKNACPVFDRTGKLVCRYEKMHLFTHFTAQEGNYVSEGTNPVLVNTDIAKLGLSVCYDIRFPELFRAYAYAGADILINAAAWPKTRLNHWVTLQKARAIENQAFMIAVSQTGKITHDESNLGHSMVISPYGEVLASLEEQEDVLYAEINLDEMRELRKKFPILKDRKENYKVLEV